MALEYPGDRLDGPVGPVGTDALTDPARSGAFVMREILLDGGGTHNHIAFSPDGSRLAAFADVGGTRHRTGSGAWRYLPTFGGNAGRQVAGGAITDDGIIFQLAGNGRRAGALQRIDTTTGAGTELVGDLHVLANKLSEGDSGPRPRPVGWMVIVDETAGLVHYATEEGIGRYDLGASRDDGIIALRGESCRGFAHRAHAIVSDARELTVCTRRRGLVRLFDVQGSSTAYRLSPAAFDRFEDAAIIDASAGSVLGAGHEQGVYRYDGDGFLAIDGRHVTAGSAIPADIASERYGLEFEGVLDWSSATSGELIGAWGPGPAAQTVGLELDQGVLRWRMRHAGGVYTLDSDVALSEGVAALAVRVRAVTAADMVLEKRVPGGRWVRIGAGSPGRLYPNGSAVALTIGATGDGASPLPASARVHRASMMRRGETVPVASLDVTGLPAGETGATGVAGDGWSWPPSMALNAGGRLITPERNPGTGRNGGATRWLAAAVVDIGGTRQAALGMVNPDGPHGWVYRASDITSATPHDWDDATPSPSTRAIGSTYNSPANRLYGESGRSGTNLTGTFAMAFDPSDPTGNTLVSSATLSLYRCTNFAGPAGAIAWATCNEGLSMVSIADVHIDVEGNGLFACADHNAFVVAAPDLTTGEPTHVSVSGIRDGWSIHSLGSAADKVTVFAPTSDRDPVDAGNDIVFHRGAGVPDHWTSTGMNADLDGAGALSSGERPRVGGLFGWDADNGTYRFVAWADGLGFIRNEITLASSSWGTWRLQSSGPTGELTTGNQLQERQVVGAFDGSVLFGVQLSDGGVWRSTDQGANWSRVAKAIGTRQGVRAGRLAYIESQDVLVGSDGDGLYRVDRASAGAAVTRITGVSSACQIAIDSSDRVYAHVRGPGMADLLRFDSFASATTANDAEQIATDDYRARAGDLACTLDIGFVRGVELGITGYQGAGCTSWTVPG